MEIGPISGIRPIAMVKPSSPSPDLSGVFAVEFREQTRDETPNCQPDERGLEDEESEELSALAEFERTADEGAADVQPRSSVNFFA